MHIFLLPKLYVTQILQLIIFLNILITGFFLRVPYLFAKQLFVKYKVKNKVGKILQKKNVLIDPFVAVVHFSHSTGK